MTLLNFDDFKLECQTNNYDIPKYLVIPAIDDEAYKMMKKELEINKTETSDELENKLDNRKNLEIQIT